MPETTEPRRADALAVAVAELKRLEWSQAGGCPACHAWMVGHPHKDGCTLRAALDVAEGAEKERAA